MAQTSYYEKLLDNLKKCYFNYYIDNVDDWYYEAAYKKPFTISMFKQIKLYIKKLCLSLKKILYSESQLENKIKKIIGNIDKYNFEYLYDNLELEKDKDFLIQIISYKILGPKRVKLTDVSRHRKYIKAAKSKCDFTDAISVSPTDNYKLYKTTFLPQYNIEMYSTPLGYVTIVNEHAYEIKNTVCVEKNDIVLDCGGYCLDSALPFAEKVGANDKVYSFEFIQDNLKLCTKNLELNPKLRDRIIIIENPLSDQNGLELSFIEDSSCSKIGNCEDKQTRKYQSTTIDHFVYTNNIGKVDFIKMDIEGSELLALKGAEKVIKQFSPKLAISVYHKLEDLDTIPKIIKEYNPNYKFYLGYTGVSDAEYVLFGKVENDKN